jgi:hypothetical protein
MKNILIEKIKYLLEVIKLKEITISNCNFVLDFYNISGFDYRCPKWYDFFNHNYYRKSNPVLEIKIFTSKKEVRFRIKDLPSIFRNEVITCYVSFEAFYKIMENMSLLDLQFIKRNLSKIKNQQIKKDKNKIVNNIIEKIKSYKTYFCVNNVYNSTFEFYVNKITVLSISLYINDIPYNFKELKWELKRFPLLDLQYIDKRLTIS